MDLGFLWLVIWSNIGGVIQVLVGLAIVNLVIPEFWVICLDCRLIKAIWSGSPYLRARERWEK